MSLELDDLLLHYGVKGMKWGVRRKRNRPGGADGKSNSKGQNGNKKRTLVGEHARSLGREWAWRKALLDIDKISTEEIQRKANRLQMENSLKQLSRKRYGARFVGNSADRKAYRNRDRMSDDELAERVNRLRAKDALHRNLSDATKEQVKYGTRVAQAAAPVLVNHAINKTPINYGEIVDNYKNPKKAQEEALNTLNNYVKNRPKQPKGGKKRWTNP